MKNACLAIVLIFSTWLATPLYAEVASDPVVSVNINSASAAEIAETLQGIGSAKAEAIVAFRDANGSFESVEALSEVKGIGQATIEKNRQRIALQ
ncbi:MAG TPA: helix-hairpin-helix domain-containing protein [Pseudomonas xinjiangensis]|uniref:Helix-hairpin-helix domain-containing protein n=2 Tax=root TaxID=1 RepID=A0A7V1BPP2_9GAMM|nr:helix-hairpin-helix domain-containing protein [Halopseudomonas xinjiangensis]HEC49375.1 helix-hairpin-helix domain-containing protein [Halopseudomonas xinjiangensis]